MKFNGFSENVLLIKTALSAFRSLFGLWFKIMHRTNPQVSNLKRILCNAADLNWLMKFSAAALLLNDTNSDCSLIREQGARRLRPGRWLPLNLALVKRKVRDSKLWNAVLLFLIYFTPSILSWFHEHIFLSLTACPEHGVCSESNWSAQPLQMTVC